MGVYIKRAEYDEVKAYADDIVEQQIERCMNELSNYFEEEDKVDYEIDDFCQVLEKLYLEVESLQREEKKGEITRIGIYYMQSYCVTNSHPFKIYAYDEKGPLDVNQCSSDWDCNCVMKYYEPNMAYLEKQIKSKFIQVSDEIWLRLKREYLLAYCIIVLDYLQNLVELLYKIDTYERICVSNPVTITFGEYLEEGEVVYQITGEESFY